MFAFPAPAADRCLLIMNVNPDLGAMADAFRPEAVGTAIISDALVSFGPEPQVIQAGGYRGFADLDGPRSVCTATASWCRWTGAAIPR